MTKDYSFLALTEPGEDLQIKILEQGVGTLGILHHLVIKKGKAEKAIKELEERFRITMTSDEKRNLILKTLLDKGGLSHGELRDKMPRKNNNTFKKIMDQLVREDYVAIMVPDNLEWHRGKKKIYRLTSKGEVQAQQLTV